MLAVTPHVSLRVPLPRPWVSISLDLPVLDLSHKWDHIIRAFCDWLLPLTVFSRTIYVVDAWKKSPLLPNNSPLYGEGNGIPFQYSCLKKSHGWRSLVGCSPWGSKELDTTEQIHFHFSLARTGEGNGNPLQCSCLENPRDGGACRLWGCTESDTTEVT